MDMRYSVHRATRLALHQFQCILGIGRVDMAANLSLSVFDPDVRTVAALDPLRRSAGS